MLHHAPSEGSAPSLGSVDEWLKIIGLDQYRENFNTAGYCSLESVIPMSHEWASQHITHLITHPDELQDDYSLTNIPCAALLQGSGQNGNLMHCTSEEDPEQRAGFIVWNASKTRHKDSCLICDEGKKNNVSCWLAWITRETEYFTSLLHFNGIWMVWRSEWMS